VSVKKRNHRLQVPPDVLNLIDRANRGDAAALRELQSRFDRDAELTAFVGDLGGVAAAMIATLAVGADAPGVVDGILTQVAALSGELEAECETGLERLLARRVAVGSLWVAIADIHLVQAHQAAGGGADPAVRAAADRLDRAQRRLESATKALGMLRKLARPARSSLIVLQAGTGKPKLPAVRTPDGEPAAPPLPLA
jgi:hypothetical protein